MAPVRREQVVKTAEKLVARGKIDAAIKEYRKVLGDQPNDINTLNRLGDLYARIEQIDDAVKLFTQIAEDYTQDGFFVKAIAIYKKINKLDPTRLEVYEKLAELYHRQGLVNEARTQYQVLAEYYLKHGNQPSALTIYERLVDLEPDDPSHRAKLADLYREQRLTDKAMAQYRSIAELMLGHGRSGEAAQVYERALDLDPSDLDLVADAVTRLREAGANAAAAKLLSLAAEKNPAAASLAAAAGLAEEAQAPADDDAIELDLDVGDEESEAEVPARPPVRAAGPAPRVFGGGAAIEEPEDDEDDAELVLDLDVGELDELPFATPSGPAARQPEPAAPPVQQASPAASASPAPAPAAPEAPESSGDPGEYELDLGDVFVLDLEDEEPPASMVQPPPDMVDAPVRPYDALSSQAPPPAAAPAPVEAHPEIAPPELDDEVFVLDEAAAHEADEEEEAERAAPPAPRPAARALESVPIDPDFLERTAAELLPPERQAEDLLTEAEVLARYGLEEKAAERLQEVLRLAPGHAEALSLLIRIDLEKGNHARVVTTANQLARRALEEGDDRAWRKVRKRLAEAGYRLDGDRVAGPPKDGAETEQAVGRMLEGLLDRPAAAGRRPRGDAARVAEALADLEAGVRPARPAPAQPPASAAPAPPAAGAIEAAEAAESPAEWGAPPDEADIASLGPAEELAAAEIAAPAPASEPAPEPLQPAAPPAAAGSAPAAPAEPLEDSGTRWLAEVEAAASSVGGAAADPLAEEEDFFDLAAEIEQELEAESRDEELLEVPREQSLEEIVEGFKQGVAESLSAEDYDTHFNLGIAYREMGLLDEAIGEFQLAAKDPGRLVECCSMLGLCFLEKGLPELAVKWYNRGLASPGLSEDDQLGLMYDLGNLYMATGDAEQARAMFVEIYGTNSHYRDVVAKLEEISAHHGR